MERIIAANYRSYGQEVQHDIVYSYDADAKRYRGYMETTVDGQPIAHIEAGYGLNTGTMYDEAMIFRSLPNLLRRLRVERILAYHDLVKLILEYTKHNQNKS